MIACNMPRPGGRLPEPLLFGNTSLWFNEMTEATAADQIRFIDRYLEEGIQLDYWWMDAGWYPCGGHWRKTGTWEVDEERFPRGLREVSDHARKRGIKTLVWFEPERVAPGTWLAEERPQWLLSVEGSQDKLLNLGNEEARRWLTDHVDRILTEQGIDLYRQDFNFDPLPYWRAADEPDREGITEIRHCEGYLAYWDELRRRHPDMLIDSCASGGRRNDLETMRRSVPLHKTDYDYWDLPTKQAFHHSLYLWIPYFASGVMPEEQVDDYGFRTAFNLAMVLGFDVRRSDLDYDAMRRRVAEWRSVAHLLYGDYYPITPYNRAEEWWIAWQFHRPDLAEGMVQAFRREGSPFVSARFRLSGLEPEATYEVTNPDRPDASESRRGADLMESGLEVRMDNAPSAVVLHYRRSEKGEERSE